MSIFFTSDTHYYHKHIIEYCKRPAADLDEMHQKMIENWNAVVKPQDEVYHLGDFAFCGVSKVVPILKQLRGIKYLIKGNHDNGLYKKEAFAEHFTWIRDYYMLRVHDVYQNEEEEILQYHQPIVLCHFPILSWDLMANGSWHLHGHCHNSLPPTRSMRMDVGVDTNGLKPWSYDEIKSIMVMKSVVPVDHHGL